MDNGYYLKDLEMESMALDKQLEIWLDAEVVINMHVHMYLITNPILFSRCS